MIPRRITIPLAAAGFAALMALLVLTAADAYGAAASKRVTYKFLSDALERPGKAPIRVTFLDPAPDLVRPFREGDEALVGKAVTEAWQAHAAAMSSGETGFLPDHFSGAALARARVSALQGLEASTGMAVLAQELRPVMYHLDGSVLQLEGEALTVRYALGREAPEVLAITRDQVVTTLMNETTGWRVFSHEMTGSAPAEALPAAPRPVPAPLAGVNYYPAETPWTLFWPQFDPETIRADLRLIAGLGANSVRIFLPREAFLDAAAAPRHLENLAALLRAAGDQGLYVVPTLFDMRPGYGPGTWAEDLAYLEAVLPVLAASPHVAFADLKNEPDLDFELQGDALVRAWLRSMIEAAHLIAPDLPVTIGWSAAEPAAAMAGAVDVVTYHDYAPLESAAGRLEAVRAAAGGRPVMVTEYGASSWSLAAGRPHSPAGQAEHLEARSAALAAADGLMVWTLHDFPRPDPAAIGRSPWVRGLQSSFGLIGPDGQEKPAAPALRRAFARYLGRSE